MFLAIYHEPENDEQADGGGMTAADYVEMYRHVVQRLRDQGVDNAVFVMNYLGFAKWATAVDGFYPGDDVVDWIAYDPYGLAKQHDFARLLNDPADGWPGFYEWATRKAPGKPMMVAEWGFDLPNQPEAAAALESAALVLEYQYPMIKALVYWNDFRDGGFEVRIDQESERGPHLRRGLRAVRQRSVLRPDPDRCGTVMPDRVGVYQRRRDGTLVMTTTPTSLASTDCRSSIGVEQRVDRCRDRHQQHHLIDLRRDRQTGHRAVERRRGHDDDVVLAVGLAQRFGERAPVRGVVVGFDAAVTIGCQDRCGEPVVGSFGSQRLGDRLDRVGRQRGAFDGEEQDRSRLGGVARAREVEPHQQAGVDRRMDSSRPPVALVSDGNLIRPTSCTPSESRPRALP